MNRWVPALALIPVAALSGTGLSEEEILPSQKTKEAVDKLKKAPAGGGKSIETLKDVVREKVGIGAGGEGKTPAQPASDPRGRPEKRPEPPQGARHSPAGKRGARQPRP